jgi:hypothetical protein
MRVQARMDGETCDCTECYEGSSWFNASANPSAWRKSSTCGKFPHPGLENPADGITPEFNHLRCSLLRKNKTKKRKLETHGTLEANKPDVYPPHAGGACTECGWDKFAPDKCPVEMSLKLCTWTQKKPEQGPKGEDLYVEKIGTRKELIELIQLHGYTYNYHMWVNQWTAHQAALDNETFNGRTQINVTCDYGSTYAMPQADVEKCGHGTSCNQYVALVLHSPRERVDAGGGVVAGPRSVICDVWRIWSQMKGSAAWPQQALKEIATYYLDGKVPGRKRAGVKSDGQRDQFKGQKNFGLNAEWPHPNVIGADCFCMPRKRACNNQTMQPGLEIEV